MKVGVAGSDSSLLQTSLLSSVLGQCCLEDLLEEPAVFEAEVVADLISVLLFGGSGSCRG